MFCKIVTPDSEQIFKNISSIILSTPTGELEILEGHAESFMVIKKGKIIISDSEKQLINASEGILYVKDNNVIITL